MPARKVAVLPEVVISHALPVVEEAFIFMPFNTPSQKVEREVVAGILITACIRARKWEPVSAKTFGTIIGESSFTRYMPQGIINELWGMVNEGYVDLVNDGTGDFIVPMEQLVEFLQSPTPRLLEVERGPY